MRKTEALAKSKRRKTQIQKIVLATVATAGVLSVAAVAPNVIQALAMFENGIIRKKRPEYVVRTAFGRLIEKGYLRVDKINGAKRVVITDAGKRALVKMIASSPDSRNHRRWDQRWRVVIYDIPERFKYKRHLLRTTLERFGFLKLQGSVWVYPYDTEELLKLLRAQFHIGKNVIYMVVEQIENDVTLRKHFGLKPPRE